jgi:teichuronic acid biosynthesis glycosyltransferase TuaG
MKAPRISVIMAAYNAENTIADAIRSVLAQTYENWELLVINDGSKDRTVEVVNTFCDKRIRLLDNGGNLGVSLTRKNGMEAATGDWIAVLDSDDLWAKDKLEKQVRLAEKTGARLMFTGSGFMDAQGNPLQWQLHVPEKLTYRQLLKQNLVSNSSVLVDAALYRQYFAVGDGMHEDFAIWLQITRAGIPAWGIDEPSLIYRLDKKSKSGNKLKSAKMNWKTYRYIGLNPISAAYYMAWYMVKGLLKYRHFK